MYKGLVQVRHPHDLLLGVLGVGLQQRKDLQILPLVWQRGHVVVLGGPIVNVPIRLIQQLVILVKLLVVKLVQMLLGKPRQQ